MTWRVSLCVGVVSASGGGGSVAHRPCVTIRGRIFVNLVASRGIVVDHVVINRRLRFYHCRLFHDYCQGTVD